jgi:hypothetical protein
MPIVRSRISAPLALAQLALLIQAVGVSYWGIDRWPTDRPHSEGIDTFKIYNLSILWGENYED